MKRYQVIINQLREENPKAVLWDGLESALVGVGRRCGKPTLAVYDYQLALRALMLSNAGMTPDEAIEWMETNVEGASVGPHTPIILDRVGA